MSASTAIMDNPNRAVIARRLALAAAFVATVYAANWALEQFGLIELPIIGWMAPAGVFFAGLGFGIRDALHESGGRSWVFACIAIGAGLSYWVSDGVTIPGGHASIAVAGGIAFALSELADFAIYAPLRERAWVGAVILSNLVGAVIDSALFLWLAFGDPFGAMGGQVLGKALMILPALPIVWEVRRRAVPRYRIDLAGA